MSRNPVKKTGGFVPFAVAIGVIFFVVMPMLLVLFDGSQDYRTIPESRVQITE